MVNLNKLERRHIRYKLYEIKRKLNQENELKNIIESQFKAGQNWNTFTFNWDVGVNDPLKVITIEEWIASGGKFDELGRRTPPGFTCQE